MIGCRDRCRADELRAADALSAVAGDCRSSAGQRLVTQSSCSVMSLLSSVLARLLRGRSARSSALRTAASMSIGVGAKRGTIDGPELRLASRVVGAADDQALQRELAPSRAWLRPAPRLPARGGFGLGLHDVDRRQRADLDADAWLSSTSLRRELERPPRDLQLATREDAVPVGVADVGERVGDGRPQLHLGDVAVDWRDAQLRAGCASMPKPRSSGCTNSGREASSCTAG